MATTKERSDLRQVAPGLYETVDGTGTTQLTHEYAKQVRQHTGSRVLEEIVEDAVRRREGKTNKSHFD